MLPAQGFQRAAKLPGCNTARCSSGAKKAMLSIVIVFLAFSKLMLPSVQALGTVVRVRDAKAFADALLDPLNRVDVIEIEKDIDLEGIRERVASLQAPVLWRKDLNIRGARPEQPRFLPLLNFRFLENAVRLAPNVTLTFSKLIGKRSRFSPSDGIMDLVAPSPGATVHTVNFVRHFYVCFPFEVALPILRNWTRSPSIPGQQRVRVLEKGWCRTGPEPRMCWPSAAEFQDVASDEAVDKQLYYTVWYQETPYVCDEMISMECLRTQALRSCGIQGINRHVVEEDERDAAAKLREAAEEEARDDEEAERRSLGLGLGIGLGGGLLLLAAAGLLGLRWRGQRKQQLEHQEQQHQETYKAMQGKDHQSLAASERGLEEGSLRSSAALTDRVLAAAVEKKSSVLSSATPDLPSPSDPSSKLDQSNTAQAVRASVSYMNDSVALSERTEGTGSLPMEQLKLLEVITDASPAQGSVDLQVDFEKDVVLGARIGQGAMGSVHEGTFRGRKVAIKLFPSEVIPEEVKAFEQELKVLSRAQHPSIVALYGACTVPPHICLVQELCDMSLALCIHNPAMSAKLTLPAILSIALDVSLGLAYLHPTVQHRDLKPDNILLKVEGRKSESSPSVMRAKITDFGLARLRASFTNVTENFEAGTVTYIPPENFQGVVPGGKVTHRGDIFSFALVLWEMVHLAKPWSGMAPPQILFHKLMEQGRPAFTALPDRCPERLQRLIECCWAHDPMVRPSASEISRELVLIAQEQGITLRGALPSTFGTSPRPTSQQLVVCRPVSTTMSQQQ